MQEIRHKDGNIHNNEVKNLGIVDRDKIAIAVMKNIADGFDERGHFLQKFARMFRSATNEQQQLLLPSAHKLIEAYDIEQGQRQKGILHEAQYS